MQERKVSVNKKLTLQSSVEYAGDRSTLTYSWAMLTDNFDLASDELLNSDTVSPNLVMRPNVLGEGSVKVLF